MVYCHIFLIWQKIFYSWMKSGYVLYLHLTFMLFVSFPLSHPASLTPSQTTICHLNFIFSCCSSSPPGVLVWKWIWVFLRPGIKVVIHVIFSFSYTITKFYHVFQTKKVDEPDIIDSAVFNVASEDLRFLAHFFLTNSYKKYLTQVTVMVVLL